MSEEEVTVNRMTNTNTPTMRPGQLKLYVCPTTGGTVKVIVSSLETVQGLKVAVSRKIRIPPERINLLFKNKILKDGTLLENNITSDSRITLLPNMTSGMTFQRPENTVMQALENLSDSQVNDFLSGRAPLLLAMRLGDHMMFVQLQLSTAQCANRRSRHGVPTNTASAQPHAVFPQAAISPASLAEASRNLSQKLKELTRLSGHAKVGETAQVTVSSQVPPPASPVASASPSSPSCSSNQGAVINSMHHLGQGVYSGTFSGTLDPTLQDIEGKPRRDIGTIVHILNDLLGSSPHYHTCRPFLVQHPREHTYTRENTGYHRSVNLDSKSDDNELRGKVRQLQKMMEERRMRRRARRQMKAPYQWTNSRPVSPETSSFCHPATLNTRDNVSGGIADSNTMEMPENVESASYRNPNLEQETVAV